MTDNQLLFEAAKAAGIDFSIKGQVPTRFDGKDFIVWNPLQHDGDALRLAVKLHQEICIEDYVVSVRLHCGVKVLEKATMGYNVEAATRRAIVRAAAEIGKEMK